MLNYRACMSPNAPAGWYPQEDGTERWWDGRAWSSHSRPVPPPPTTPMPVGHSGGHYGSDLGWAPVSVPRYVVAPKSPGVALLASFFIPGLGSMLNGDVGKGVAFLLTYLLCWFLFILLVPLLIAFVIWVWAMIDAYQGAVRWNDAHGIIS